MPKLLTRREAAQIGRIPLKRVDKAVEQRIVRPCRARGKTMFEPQEVAALALLSQLPTPLPVTLKRRLRNWLVHQEPAAIGARFPLSEALMVLVTRDVVEAHRRATEYAGLRDKYIETNPQVLGGEPVITGTRMPVRSLARLIEMGESPQVLREDHPSIPEEAYDVAVTWAKAHPRRGRPVPPWREGKPNEERPAQPRE